MSFSKLLFVIAATICLSNSGVDGSGGSPWPPSSTRDALVILNKMNLTQKLMMVHGWAGNYAGNTPSIMLDDGTCIPAFHEHDGPQGVANGAKDVTCWPAALTVVQTWDASLMYMWGAAMGREQYLKGSNIMLGPGVNLARLPWNGRNFEYQGEDPYLASAMVGAEVRGIQSQNVSGCVKHYVFNNEETERSGISSNVPDRAAKELYYRPFAAAVDAGVGSAMCAYNRVNGTWACEDTASLNEIKNILGFKGFVMSDWGATHSTVAAALAGLDQQMPDDLFFGPSLADAVANGTVPLSRIDDMVMRMLTPMLALNLFTTQAGDAPGADPNRNGQTYARSPEHDKLALDLAQASIVLLKNDAGLLPISPSDVKKVAVFGDETTIYGFGSGQVVAPYIITPWQGIYSLLNGGTAPPVAGVCVTENDFDYFQATGDQIAPYAATPVDCCNACAAAAFCNAFTLTADGTCYLKPDASGRTPSSGIISGNCTSKLQPPSPAGDVLVNFFSTQEGATAVANAAGSDLIVVVVAVDSTEGSDRPSMGFPPWMDELVFNLSSAYTNVVVVARCPGACTMPWADIAPAILFELLGGQESGNSIANTIFGGNNPSGRLAVTFPKPAPAGSQYPTDTWLSPVGGGPVKNTSWPGTDRGRGFPEVDFSEELLMGYRWYDAQKTKPEFSFGHGLSYSTFTYTALTVSGAVSDTTAATIFASVCNAAGPSGAEVAQLYIGFPAAANEPPKLLKGFQKLALSPSQCGRVSFPIAAKDLVIWDVITQTWQLNEGEYILFIAASSVDIRLTGTLTVTKNALI